MLGTLLRELLGGINRPRHTAAEEACSAIEDAKTFLSKGDFQEAQQRLRQIIEKWPRCAEAHRLLGSVLGRSGLLDEACEVLLRAVSLQPRDVRGLVDLGNVYRLLRQPAAAENCYRRALANDPTDRSAHFNFAMLEQETGSESAAVNRLLPLLEPPAHSDAVRELIGLLDKFGRVSEGKALCERVLEREPQQAVAHAALGFLLLKRDFCPQQALRHFSRALELGMVSEDLLSNAGIALQDLGRLDEAIASYDRALSLNAKHRPARFHRALAMLQKGEFEQAWHDYEVRLESEDAPPPPQRMPSWTGEHLGDRPLLVYGEQGIGDEIMFASCLADLSRLCSHLIIACTAKLEPLLGRSFPAAKVMSLDCARASPPPPELRDAAAMVPMGTLPLYFRRTASDFPQHDGYLVPNQELVAEYRARLEALGPELKVGFSWRGGSVRSRQALRTLNRQYVDSLITVPGVRFINLQYDSSADATEVADWVAAGKLVHWPEALADYERTAALVAALDLIISVCTAVVHLAGALGRPVWVMAPFSAEWRYGIHGEGMPWYPSARIIRQSSPGAWDSVIESVRERLRALAA